MYYVIFFYLFLADAKIIIWSQKESSSDFPKKKDKACKNTTLATLSRDIEKNWNGHLDQCIITTFSFLPPLPTQGVSIDLIIMPQVWREREEKGGCQNVREEVHQKNAYLKS